MKYLIVVELILRYFRLGHLDRSSVCRVSLERERDLSVVIWGLMVLSLGIRERVRDVRDGWWSSNDRSGSN